MLTIGRNRHKVATVLLRDVIPGGQHGSAQQTGMHLIAGLHERMSVLKEQGLLINDGAGAVLLRNKNHRRQRRVAKTLRLAVFLSYRNDGNSLIGVSGRVGSTIVGRFPGQGASFDMSR